MKKRILEQDTAPTPSPSPSYMPKAYFMIEDIRDLVVMTVNELAPNGVGSQSEYLSLLSKSLDQTQNDLAKKIPNSKILSSITLTLAEIERELSKVPFHAIIKAT
jgi:hypothetical protein